MKIAIFTDGNLEMGMGHVYRSITLAKELQQRGGRIHFLTKSDQVVVNKIKSSGFNVFKVKNINDIFLYLKKINPRIVIVDRLKVEEDFARELKEKITAKLVIFDNLSPANKYADIVINVIGSNFNNSTFVDKKTGTLYYCGPKYYILREDFYKYKRKRKKISDKIRKILLLFGGCDPLNLTSKVLNELLCWEDISEIDVVVGIGYKYFDELNKVVNKHAKRKYVRIYKDVENIAEMMYKADLVITSPGLSMFEALCVGTPVIAINQTQFHKKVFSDFFPTLNDNEINKLHNVILSKNFIYPESEYVQRLRIGEGKYEIIKAIMDLK